MTPEVRSLRGLADTRRVTLEHAAPPTPRRIGTIFVLAFLLACIIGRLAILRFDNSPDGEMFVLMGKLVAEGKTPGVDVLDVKSPSVGILMSVPWHVLGANWLGWGILSITLAVAASVVLIRASALAGGVESKPIALVTCAAILSFTPFVHTIFQLEHVLVLTSAIGALGAVRLITESRRRSAFLLGIAAGTGLLLKPTAIGIVIAALVTVYLVPPIPRKRRVRLALLVGSGVMVPLIFFAIYLTLAGEWTVFANSQRAIAAYQSHSTRSFSTMLARAAEVCCIVLFPVLLAALLTRRQSRQTKFRGKLAAFAAIWFAIDLGLALAQGRTYPYYFLPLACPATLLAATLIRGGSPAVLAATFLPMLCLNVMSLAKPLELQRDRPRADIAAKLLEISSPNDTVWMNDWPRLAAMSDRRIVSPVPHYRMMVIDDESPKTLGNRLLSDIRNQRPTWLVVPWSPQTSLAWTSPELEANPIRRERFEAFLASLGSEIDANYSRETESNSWAIFKRNE